MIFNGRMIVENDGLVMVDGNYYFPRVAVNKWFLRNSRLTTICGWKVAARSWGVVLGDEVSTNMDWA